MDKMLFEAEVRRQTDTVPAHCSWERRDITERAVLKRDLRDITDTEIPPDLQAKRGDAIMAFPGCCWAVQRQDLGLQCMGWLRLRQTVAQKTTVPFMCSLPCLSTWQMQG